MRLIINDYQGYHPKGTTIVPMVTVAAVGGTFVGFYGNGTGD